MTAAHHETPDVAELRRLLDVNRGRDFHVLPWHAWDRGIGYELHVGATCRDEMEPRGYCEEVNNGFRETFGAPEAELIVAAVNALPTLLDELDELRAEVGVRRDARKALAHMREARNNARAERDALAAKVERVRALHRAFGIYDECDCDDPDPARPGETVAEAVPERRESPDVAELRRLRDTEREELHSPTRRLDAYYYSFSETGSVPIDAILSAVAIAGKSCHNTDRWTEDDEWSRWGVGRSLVDVIQCAANEAATALLDAAAERDRLAEAVRAYVDDWDLLVEEMRQTGLDEVVLTMTPVGEVTS